MTDRRDFLHRLAAAGAGLGTLPLAAHAAGSQVTRGATSPDTRAGAPLRILILGGTGFLGPYFVHETTSRGHQVSIFTRGQREPSLFEADFSRVEHLIGDRTKPDGLAALRGRTWDAVIETSGQRHDWTKESTALLKGSVGRYLYVSSTGVFLPYLTTNIPEDGPVRRADEPPQDPPSYGVMKARSEDEVRAAFPDGAIVVRPGYIVGPGDPTDRWTYWPMRIVQGGEILVPGLKGDPVQYIDVRDLISWMVRLLEDGTTGTFNATGPARKQTMAEFVYGVASITSVPLSWTWVEDHAWLEAYPLRRRDDGTTSGLTYAVPWLIPAGENLGHMQIDNRRAIAAGLTFRPLATTAADTVAWRSSDAVPAALRERPRYVITREQEAEMLKAWKAR